MKDMKEIKRMVVKVGSSTLTHSGGGLNFQRIDAPCNGAERYQKQWFGYCPGKQWRSCSRCSQDADAQTSGADA